MGNCDTRQMLYIGAGDDPTSITETWLESQICSQVDVKNQYCWVLGDYVYFVVDVAPADSGIVGTIPPTITRKILINDLNDILRDDTPAELYWDQLE